MSDSLATNIGNLVAEGNAAEGNEVEPEGGKEGVDHRVELAVEPSRPGEVLFIYVDVPWPRLWSSGNMIILSLSHAVFVLFLSLGILRDANVTLFAACLCIILPGYMIFNEIAINLVASTIRCSALKQHYCAELACFFTVVELNLAVLYKVAH